MRTGTVLPESFLRLMSKEDRAKLGAGGITAQEAASKAQIRNERHLQSLIVNLLRLKGIEVLWHRTDKRSAATVGWMDLTFAIRGQACGFECKFEKGQLSEEQEKMIQSLRGNGWHIEIVRSVDDALKFLQGYAT